jgi:hypothetical protein
MNCQEENLSRGGLKHQRTFHVNESFLEPYAVKKYSKMGKLKTLINGFSNNTKNNVELTIDFEKQTLYGNSF